MATKPGLYANIHAKQARIAAGSKAEVKAGKPVKQAVAIAYAVKRKVEKKK